jgi:glycerate dehydrogenase
MNIVILDYATLGYDLDLSGAEKFGNVTKYEKSTSENTPERIKDADIIIVNKIKLTESILSQAKNLKLICETATGYDNIDTNYCKAHGIKVANTPAYSTYCVAQLTVSMASYLMTHLGEYRNFVHSGGYFKSESANSLTPVFNEFFGKTWGIIGFGNIGKAVYKVADALGCNVLVNKRTKENGYNCVDLETLLKESDIISIHTPLNESTKNLIDKAAIEKMKTGVMVINVARGAVWDENEIANAILNGKIGAIGCDVYSTEPIRENHPFAKLLDKENVVLTPHMAWGGLETRRRCYDIVLSNIESFLNGTPQNIVG